MSATRAELRRSAEMAQSDLLRECPYCNDLNPPSAEHCESCGGAVTLQAAYALNLAALRNLG